jgi:hypothetical protein
MDVCIIEVLKADELLVRNCDGELYYIFPRSVEEMMDFIGRLDVIRVLYW